MWTKPFRTSSLFALLSAFLVLIGCAKTRAVQPVAEEPPAPPPAAAVALPASQPLDTTRLPAPALEHVQATVNRIFQDSVTIDSSHNPSYFLGDFNGDQSQDLAVILKPVSAKLSFLNQDFPTWIAREPLKQILLPKSKVANPSLARGNEDPSSGQTIRFAANDTLLVIVHGYGEKGWRDPESTQTHVLRDVVGDDIRLLPFASVAKAYKGIKPFPSIYGDLIQETLIGQAGFLHFAGGVYEWYDSKNYKPVLGPAHSGLSAVR